jgi:hypothetical protein
MGTMVALACQWVGASPTVGREDEEKQRSRGGNLCFSSMLVVSFAQPKGPTIMLEG